jgi:hypothetical protein
MGKLENAMIVQIGEYANIETPDEKIDQAIGQHEVNIDGRIFPGIGFAMAVIA